MTDRRGQRLGNYRVLGLLGQGGFADVYLAEHIHLGTQAAIKILHTQLTNQDEERFRHEARTIARLEHPHIVRVLDFGLEGTTPFLVMNYASHGNVRERHPRGTPLPLTTIVDYVKQVANALQYAHDEKVIHRDIKPENMLIGRNNTILLSDFGLALIAGSSSFQSMKESAGTAYYMAPEQLQGKPRQASDQYALGVVVYEWLCGQRPFDGTFTEIYHQHVFLPPPPLRVKVAKLSAAVEAVVFTALAKDPQRRFAHVQAFATALEQAAELRSFPLIISSLENSGPTQVAPDIHHLNTIVAGKEENSHVIRSFPGEFSAQTLPPSTIGETGKMHPITMHLSPVQHDMLPSLTQPAIPFPPDATEKPRNTASFAYNATGLAASANAASMRRPDSENASRDPRLRKRQRVYIVSALVLCTLLLIFGSVTGMIPTGLRFATATLLGASLSISVIITPTRKVVEETYRITAVTGQPASSQQQVQARLLSSTSSLPSKVVTVTGVKNVPGGRARGKLTFYNGSLRSVTINVGTVFQGVKGIQLQTDEVAIIPSATPPTEGSVTVSAHAVNIGKSGNIHASEMHKTCCVTGDFILVTNTSAFSGGWDSEQYTFVQQQDIDAAIAPLLQESNSRLRSQLQPKERMARPSQCVSTATSHPKVYEKASRATITATAVCTGEVYDQQAIQARAIASLQKTAREKLGVHYMRVGNVLTQVVRMTIDAKKTVSLLVSAKGVWVYQFQDAQIQTFAQRIAGKKQKDAQTLLRQAGAATVNIQGGEGSESLLPADPHQIKVIVLNR